MSFSRQKEIPDLMQPEVVMAWVNQDLTLLANASQPLDGSAIGGFDDGGDAQQGYGQHFFFVNTDRHVHQLFLNSRGVWADQDLTRLAQGPEVAPGSPISTRRGDTNAMLPLEWACYIGADRHVHLLSFVATSGTWVDYDLSESAASQELPSPGGPLQFLADDWGLHAFYLGGDLHIHQLYGDGNKWVDQDLTFETNGPQAPNGTGLFCFPLDPREHLFYIAVDQHVHKMYFDGNKWVDQDWTQYAATKTIASTSSLLYSALDGPGQHAFYVGIDAHLHQIFFNNQTWVDQDLTAQANGPVVTKGSSVISFVDYPELGYSEAEVVFYVSADQHIHQLQNEQPWRDYDLTGGQLPLVQPGGGIAVFADANNGQHVIYVAADQHLHQLYQPAGVA